MCQLLSNLAYLVRGDPCFSFDELECRGKAICLVAVESKLCCRAFGQSDVFCSISDKLLVISWAVGVRDFRRGLVNPFYIHNILCFLDCVGKVDSVLKIDLNSIVLLKNLSILLTIYRILGATFHTV